MHFNQVEFLANPDEVAHARVSSMWKLVDSLKLVTFWKWLHVGVLSKVAN